MPSGFSASRDRRGFLRRQKSAAQLHAIKNCELRLLKFLISSRQKGSMYDLRFDFHLIFQKEKKVSDAPNIIFS